jgi:hypothetical protein
MTRASAVAGEEPVEEYLDALLGALGGPPRQVRHTLAEVEEHLRDVVDEGLAAGLATQQAEATAVERIGAVHVVAGRRPLFIRPAAGLARGLMLGTTLVAGVGLVAFGIAGAVSWLLAKRYGGLFVVAPFPGGSYTPADCVRWLAGDPATHSCVTAMTADHVGDIVLQGAAGAVLGLVALALHVLLRRRWQDRATRTALPRASTEITGAALALLTAIVALADALDLVLVKGGWGTGQPLSLAAAALGATAVLVLRARHAWKVTPESR